MRSVVGGDGDLGDDTGETSPFERSVAVGLFGEIAVFTRGEVEFGDVVVITS